MDSELLKKLGFFLAVLVLLGSGLACQKGSGRSLYLAAYTTPREAFREINDLFEKYWKGQTGEEIDIKESYLSSGAQSRAVVDGFEADVVALALEKDVERIAEVGLITGPWRKGPHGGMLTHSIVAFAVRPGNPYGIQDWKDLLKPGLEVLTPNPKTSGGAQWNVLAVYGAAKRGRVPGFTADDAGAQMFLEKLLGQVTAMDKGARDSILTFERGLGDVALSYENEIRTGQAHGNNYEMIVPGSTILIENPVALVDKNIDKHKNRDLAEAYLQFLYSPPAQEIFLKHGFRPVHPEVLKAHGDHFQNPKDLFTIQEFGGWDQAMEGFFADDGIFIRATEKVRRN